MTVSSASIVSDTGNSMTVSLLSRASAVETPMPTRSSAPGPPSAVAHSHGEYAPSPCTPSADSKIVRMR